MAALKSGRSVLIVEEHANLREELSGVLEAAGYCVAGVADGLEALHHLRQAPPTHLILLDLMMPVMTGWEFRQHQQRDLALAAIPVVLCSAIVDLENQAEALGAAAHLPKPPQTDALLAVVARHCG